MRRLSSSFRTRSVLDIQIVFQSNISSHLGIDENHKGLNLASRVIVEQIILKKKLYFFRLPKHRCRLLKFPIAISFCNPSLVTTIFHLSPANAESV